MRRTFLFLLFISTLGFSQEKFIEVLVKDTIILKPISFEYTIKSDIGLELSFEELNKKNRTELIKEADKKVLNFLKNGNYKFEEIKVNNLFVNLIGSQVTNYTVFIPNLVSKKQLEDSIEKKKGIEIFLTKTYYEKNELTEEKIYSKLLKKANKRAELLARIKDLKILEVIEISETKASETILSNFMEKLLERGDNILDVTTTFLNNDGVLRKSISVKYKVE